MGLVFRSPHSAIEHALKKLKRDGVVYPDAAFNHSAPGSLRREVAYYDRDFMYRLGRSSVEQEVVDSALEMLKANDLAAGSACYDKAAGAWVIAHDNIDWTFATEMAEYLPYVRESGHFSESISFEIDECGLEVSIK